MKRIIATLDAMLITKQVDVNKLIVLYESNRNFPLQKRYN